METKTRDKTILVRKTGQLSLIAIFMGPTWGPSGADRTQVGPMLAPWTLLSGVSLNWGSYDREDGLRIESLPDSYPLHKSLQHPPHANSYFAPIRYGCSHSVPIRVRYTPRYPTKSPLDLHRTLHRVWPVHQSILTAGKPLQRHCHPTWNSHHLTHEGWDEMATLSNTFSWTEIFEL